MLEMMIEKMGICGLPFNADVATATGFFVVRYGTNFCRRLMRKLEKIVIFYLFVIIGFYVIRFLANN